MPLHQNSQNKFSPSPSPEKTEPAPLPEHRIGVRVVDGAGEFYDRLTGEKFIPRGNNHISLDPMQKKGGGQVITFSMFNKGFYDHAEASKALAADAYGWLQRGAYFY